MSQTDFDIFVIGGGINGCGIARDAAGRGLKVGLAEMNDLASATSSASTKLFHGGLRYLEFFEFRLVKEALAERETLLRAMPHIAWPMRFVLPYHKDMRFEVTTPTSRLLSIVMPWMKGSRPAWLIRLGLYLYDSLGRSVLLPKTAKLDLTIAPEGLPLQDKFQTAFEYSDCWIEDSRLVVLNARDAEDRGASIHTRTKVVSVQRHKAHWEVVLEGSVNRTITTKVLVNAGGPWVEDIIRTKVQQNTTERVRLVKGSHIVVPKVCEHEKCYFLQGEDGRIIFAIPYETDFTLIGTTDADHLDANTKPVCSLEEQEYLCAFANAYFKKPTSVADIVWSFSGVRPLYDDGASTATQATRDYVLSLDSTAAPILNIFGGKITTYRKLAEHAMEKLRRANPEIAPSWTAGAPLAGGDFPVNGVDALCSGIASKFPFLTEPWIKRLVRAYGTQTYELLGTAVSISDLGQEFGHTLTEREVEWLMMREYAQTAEDVLWRRSKLGLRFDRTGIQLLEAFMQRNSDAALKQGLQAKGLAK
ncbi:MAG: glycerol-3-phosphate dehydrogenase [Sulfitobacter sp.]|uniref:glycerol-3-phosphate dehydrogenase n=1 Tax=Celeribacter marinus TaxID=1397108 RepID=UPI0031711DE8